MCVCMCVCGREIEGACVCVCKRESLALHDALLQFARALEAVLPGVCVCVCVCTHMCVCRIERRVEMSEYVCMYV